MKLSILFAFLLQIVMVFGVYHIEMEDPFLETSIKTMDNMIDDIREEVGI